MRERVQRVSNFMSLIVLNVTYFKSLGLKSEMNVIKLFSRTLYFVGNVYCLQKK